LAPSVVIFGERFVDVGFIYAFLAFSLFLAVHQSLRLTQIMV